MPKTLTVDMLKKHTEGKVRLPDLSAAEGEDVELRYRWLGREEYLSLIPASPPGSSEWPREEFAARAEAWYRTLPADVRERREAQARDILYGVVSLAALEPRLTLDQARQLAGDAEFAAVAILRASKLIPEAALVAETTEQAKGEQAAEPEPAGLANAA